MNLEICRNALIQSFADRPKRPLPIGRFTEAAVLIPLFEKNGETFVLFIQRTLTVRHHKGQISFPGGARDETDADLLTTALRETHEEIGLASSQVTPIVEMDDMVTPTNFRVTPFAGTVAYPFHLKLNPHETESVLEIPLAHFFEERNHRLGFRRWISTTFEVHYFDFERHSVWGVTGHMVYEMVLRLRKTLQL